MFNKMISIFVLLFITMNTGFVYSQTQIEMNKQAYESYEKADKELNKIYKRILLEYKDDSEFIKNLKASQRIWITFRDAELKVKYPNNEPNYYGSFHPVCVANYLEQLTKQRIKTLKVWITVVEEGDMCSGSIKVKN